MAIWVECLEEKQKRFVTGTERSDFDPPCFSFAKYMEYGTIMTGINHCTKDQGITHEKE